MIECSTGGPSDTLASSSMLVRSAEMLSTLSEIGTGTLLNSHGFQV
jgi:hypothetical protein